MKHTNRAIVHTKFTPYSSQFLLDTIALLFINSKYEITYNKMYKHVPPEISSKL